MVALRVNKSHQKRFHLERFRSELPETIAICSEGTLTLLYRNAYPSSDRLSRSDRT